MHVIKLAKGRKKVKFWSSLKILVLCVYTYIFSNDIIIIHIITFIPYTLSISQKTQTYIGYINIFILHVYGLVFDVHHNISMCFEIIIKQQHKFVHWLYNGNLNTQQKTSNTTNATSMQYVSEWWQQLNSLYELHKLP